MNASFFFRLLRRTVAAHAKHVVHERLVSSFRPIRTVEKWFWFLHPLRALRLYIAYKAFDLLWRLCMRFLRGTKN